MNVEEFEVGLDSREIHLPVMCWCDRCLARRSQLTT